MNNERRFLGVIFLIIIISLGSISIYLQKIGRLNLFQKNEEKSVINNIGIEETPKVKFYQQVTDNKDNNSEKKSDSCESLKNS